MPLRAVWFLVLAAVLMALTRSSGGTPPELATGTAPLPARQTWQTALGQMPLLVSTPLDRTNCVETMLRAFRSNEAVKALIFMPGATDEFYMFKRANVSLTNSAPTLLDAVSALANQTLVRATFRPPFLLL